jgi:hypothetical protein
MRVGTRTPPLGDAEWLKRSTPRPVLLKKLARVLKRQVLAHLPVGIRRAEWLDDVSGIGDVPKNHVVDGYAEVKLAFLVEVENVVDCVRGLVFPDVVEGAAIPKGPQFVAVVGV